MASPLAEMDSLRNSVLLNGGLVAASPAQWWPTERESRTNLKTYYMILKAYELGPLIVFAPNGVTAKSFAAPTIRTSEEWCNDVTGWVALMADRRADLDHLLDQSKTETYIHSK